MGKQVQAKGLKSWTIMVYHTRNAQDKALPEPVYAYSTTEKSKYAAKNLKRRLEAKGYFVLIAEDDNT